MGTYCDAHLSAAVRMALSKAKDVEVTITPVLHRAVCVRCSALAEFEVSYISK